MFFNFLKSKPTLKELIPKGFVDIHSHILPGIDDGAKNIEESLKLISEMKKLGFSKIIATPHTYPGLYDNDNESIINSFNQINHQSPISLACASEYMIDVSLIKKAEKRELLCLKDQNVLIESNFLYLPEYFHEVIFQLQHYGYTPILAHPERYIFLSDNFQNFYKMKKYGCKFQINLLSTVGLYGKNIANICDKLIKENIVDYVGSDIHSMKHIKAFDKKLIIRNFESLKKVFDNNHYFED